MIELQLAVCARCGHSEADHRYGFLCAVSDCRCPGWLRSQALWERGKAVRY